MIPSASKSFEAAAGSGINALLHVAGVSRNAPALLPMGKEAGICLVAAKAHLTGGRIHLIPVSARGDAQQHYSLIRLIDGDNPPGAGASLAATFGTLLDEGRRLTGDFLIDPQGFCSQGLLNAYLLEFRSLDAGPETMNLSPG